MPVEEMPVPTFYQDYAMNTDFWFASAWMTAIFIAILIWSGVWKAMALWRAARNNHLAWFIALIILNTAGILEILYYFIWGKKKNNKSGTPST